jgi:hypothetical protein
VRRGKPIDLFLDAEGLDDHAIWLAGDEPRFLHTERAGGVDEEHAGRKDK